MKNIQKWRPIGCDCEVLQLVEDGEVSFITEGQAQAIIAQLRKDPTRKIRPDAETANKTKKCDKHKNLQSPHFYQKLLDDSAEAALLLENNG